MILAFETSCDETSAAVVQNGRVLSNVVSSQVALHAEYGGVVPELAAREHLRNLLPVATAALSEAGVTPLALQAVAATQGPGLPNALLMGLKAAQAFAFAIDRPFVGINHHEAHLYSAWAEGRPLAARFDQFRPNVSLIVSGGHTMLLHVQQELQHTVLGSTLDDAAGECFDKVGKMLGLPYPAGPHIDRLAEGGNPAAHGFPRPLLNDNSHDFSFSGLKTSVRYFLRDHPEAAATETGLRDICASLQAAIVEVLVTKTLRAARRVAVRCVTASGGVTCNRALRAELVTACERRQIALRIAERSLSTDNAAMVGLLAERKLLHGEPLTSLDADIRPGWKL